MAQAMTNDDFEDNLSRCEDQRLDLGRAVSTLRAEFPGVVFMIGDSPLVLDGDGVLTTYRGQRALLTWWDGPAEEAVRLRLGVPESVEEARLMIERLPADDPTQDDHLDCQWDDVWVDVEQLMGALLQHFPGVEFHIDGRPFLIRADGRAITAAFHYSGVNVGWCDGPTAQIVRDLLATLPDIEGRPYEWYPDRFDTEVAQATFCVLYPNEGATLEVDEDFRPDPNNLLAPYPTGYSEGFRDWWWSRDIRDVTLTDDQIRARDRLVALAEHEPVVSVFHRVGLPALLAPTPLPADPQTHPGPDLARSSDQAAERAPALSDEEASKVKDLARDTVAPYFTGPMSGGIQRFSKLPVAELARLVPLLPHDWANMHFDYCPSLAEFVALGEEWPALTLNGFIFDDSRSREYIAVEACWLPANDESCIAAMRERRPSELKRHHGGIYAWWD